MREKNIKITKVIDGDTMKGADKKNYRLAGVNAPEKGKPNSLKAQTALAGMVEGKVLKVKTVGMSYGRPVVEAHEKGVKTSVNERMQRKGFK